MSIEYLKENLLIELEINNHFIKGRFPSRIEMIGGQTISVAYPIYKGALIPIRKGEHIQATFIYKQQVYAFTSRVLGRVNDTVPLLVLERPLQLSKIQRRQFVRIEVSIPIEFRKMPENKELEEEDSETIVYPGRGHTVNISGGGVLFITKYDIKMEELLELRMNLPKRGQLITRARPVRIEPVDTYGDKRLAVAVCFEGIKESERDAIVAFIFERQREMLKRGLDRG